MAVKIRLKRMGKIRTPFYRIVVADARTKRDGRVIEQIGTYNPKTEPSLINVDSDRALHWLSVGAQPSEPVRALLRKTGDWQRFKGEPAPPPLLEAAPKRDKTEAFNEALKDAHGDSVTEGATTKKAAKKRSASDEPKADEAKADEAKADEAKADEAKADEAKADEAKADEPKADEAEQSDPADQAAKG